MASFSGLQSSWLLLIACSHLVFLLAETASDCTAKCTDYSKLCPSFRDSSFYGDFLAKQKTGELGKLRGHHVPPTPDCTKLYYQYLCPLSCNQCTTCDVTELSSVAQSNAISLTTLSSQLESEKAANAELERKITKCTDYVESQETSPEVDSENYRLVFKHSSNQITATELESLFRFGTVSGLHQTNMGKDQFRDPSFHFYWPDTTSARLDTFDATGQKDLSIYLQLPARTPSNFASANWPGIFESKCKFVRDSSKNDQTKFQYCSKSQFYDDSQKPRMMISEDDFCNFAWFFVQGGTSKYVCDLEKVYRASAALDSDYTVAYYNGFGNMIHNEVGMRMASRFEIRITGSFAASATNGFSRVFRYPSFAGVHVMDYFESGTTDPSADRSEMTAAHVKIDEMYRNSKMKKLIKNAGLVMFVIYDQQGAVAEALTFKATGKFKSWFSFDNLVSSINWKIQKPANGFKYFDIGADSANGRHFYIQETYNGCENDPGYLLVACNKPNGDPPCTNYESMGDNSGDPRNYICKILHTTSNGIAKSLTFAVASAMEIFVK